MRRARRCASRSSSTSCGCGPTARPTSRSWRIWTFHLLPGVRFHDGTPLDADAVVFSLERQRDPNHPYRPRDLAYESLFRDVTAIEKVDRLTVRITARQPYAPLLANLSI